MSGDANPSQTANVEPANVDPESRTESGRERIAPNAPSDTAAAGALRSLTIGGRVTGSLLR